MSDLLEVHSKSGEDTTETVRTSDGTVSTHKKGDR